LIAKWLELNRMGSLWRRAGFVTGIFTVLSTLLGCGHYQLGSGGKLSFSTLYVAPFTMRALIPQALPIMGAQVRDAFIQDGRVQLVNQADDAEVSLQVTVRDYHREVATVRPGDTGLARKFVISLTVEATLVETATGNELFHNRTMIVKRDVYTDSGQQQAEYQILPLLAQDMAQKLTHAVLDTW
jgi:hypothetical protein